MLNVKSLSDFANAPNELPPPNGVVLAGGDSCSSFEKVNEAFASAKLDAAPNIDGALVLRSDVFSDSAPPPKGLGFRGDQRFEKIFKLSKIFRITVGNEGIF